MSNSKSNNISDLARAFLEPKNSTHRQYEALRAYYVDGLSSADAAARFGYTPGSFRLICHQFRKNNKREFFLPPQKGPKKSPKKDRLREQIIEFRKKNYSVHDIKEFLKNAISVASIAKILKGEGFERLPRRRDEERPHFAHPEAAPVADARKLNIAPRHFKTKFGGLFLFLAYLAKIPLDDILEKAGFPGTSMIQAGHAMRALLGLKLFGNARHSHVMSYVFDEGLALFAGLNAIPKRSFLTEYSCRIDPNSHPVVMNSWFDAVGKMGLTRGVSFDLDFHTIPFHGEEALIEKHYVSKRSRRQKGILAFLAWDSDGQCFCYANSNIRKSDQNDEILKFIEFWKKKTGHFPEELIFDSKLTTYENLDRLNKMNIRFTTLRRRSKKMIDEIADVPVSSWNRIELENMSREYKHPKILDQTITLSHYEGPIRQVVIADLGHEEPTFMITNQLKLSATKLVDRYARRMIIENGIADSIDFFHMDALSSAVAMKVDCDLQLTLMAGSLYRMLGAQIGRGYATSRSRHIFRDFIDATANVTITENDIVVRFQKRAHNPLLIAAGFNDTNVRIPWLGNKRLKLQFG